MSKYANPTVRDARRVARKFRIVVNMGPVQMPTTTCPLYKSKKTGKIVQFKHLLVMKLDGVTMKSVAAGFGFRVSVPLPVNPMNHSNPRMVVKNAMKPKTFAQRVKSVIKKAMGAGE